MKRSLGAADSSWELAGPYRGWRKGNLNASVSGRKVQTNIKISHNFICKGESTRKIDGKKELCEPVILNMQQETILPLPKIYQSLNYHYLTTWCKDVFVKIIFCSACQWISCLLWKWEVHYRVHNSQPLIPTLTNMNRILNSKTLVKWNCRCA